MWWVLDGSRDAEGRSHQRAAVLLLQLPALLVGGYTTWWVITGSRWLNDAALCAGFALALIAALFGPMLALARPDLRLGAQHPIHRVMLASAGVVFALVIATVAIERVFDHNPYGVVIFSATHDHGKPITRSHPAWRYWRFTLPGVCLAVFAVALPIGFAMVRWLAGPRVNLRLFYARLLIAVFVLGLLLRLNGAMLVWQWRSVSPLPCAAAWIALAWVAACGYSLWLRAAMRLIDSRRAEPRAPLHSQLNAYLRARRVACVAGCAGSPALPRPRRAGTTA